MRTMRFLLATLVMVCLSACAKTVTSGVGAAARVGKASVDVGASAAVDVVSDGDTSATIPLDRPEPRPFDASQNVMMEIDAALGAAAINGRNVLLILGGNWCRDSRSLAAQLERDELARIVERGYELVWVDVGYRDRNLDVAPRFGVNALRGAPTVLILSPQGELINTDSVHEWRTAAAKPYEEIRDYFQRYAGGR